jgi:hypothetical protein
MKCTISWAKTLGLPAYSSARAAVDLIVDIPEASVSECPDVIVAEIRRAFLMAQTEVEHQLATVHQVEQQHHQPTRQQPEPARQQPEYRNGMREEQYPDGTRTLRGTPGGKPHDGLPRDGRQCVAWARRLEQSGEYPNLFRRLCQYGKSQGYDDRMVSWSRSEVDDAVMAVIGASIDDEPEPSAVPPARNGYSARNGNGRSY